MQYVLNITLSTTGQVIDSYAHCQNDSSQLESVMSRQNGKIQILDGAMVGLLTRLPVRSLIVSQGTTLDLLKYDVCTPLWGCDLLLTNPAAIRQVHKGFGDAGADIVETAT